MTDPAPQCCRSPSIAGKFIVLAIALAALTAAAFAVKVGRHYYLPKRFYEVQAGQLYRSGYIEPAPLKQVIESKKIKTILCLLSNEPNNPDQRKEEAVARAEDVKLVRIGMPGNGCGRFEDLDRAADEMADAADRPILVHCAGGENRTGAAYAAYRMKHCGWSFDRAIAEGDNFGLSIRDNAQLVAHLRAYRDHLAAASQPAGKPAPQP